ncbi:MAG: tetratricopeptide repeat protein [Planctomycetaceae bacterium]
MNDRATGFDTVGKIMLEVGRNDEAVTAFSALAKVNNDTPGDHHYWLALAQYRKDDLKAAETNLERYFESNRRSRESLQLLSDIYRAASRSDEVTSRLTDLAKDSNDVDTVNMFLGDLLVEKGNGAEAAKVYQSVISNSGNADAYIGLIRVDILNGDARSLMQSVNKALRARIRPEELMPLIAYITNNREFGENVVKAAVAVVDDGAADQDAAATYFYGQIAAALEMPEQEATLLQATLQQNPPPALGIEAMSKLGVNQLLNEKYAEASTAFRNLLAIPGLPKTERLMSLYRLSFAEVELGNYDVAITAVETALQLEPDNAQLTYQLGTIQLQAKQFDNAEKSLKTAIRLADGTRQQDSIESQGRVLLGSLYTQLSRWDDAISAYQELLQMPELNDTVIRRGRMMLSNAYVQKGDIAGGEKILQEVYAQDPTDIGINNDLGYLYAEQNKNLEQAEKMVRLAVEAEPDNPAYLDSLGWVLYRMQKHEEAEEALIKANSDPDYRDATIIEHLGDVQQALKKTAEATRAWQEALDVEKASPAPDQAVIKRLTEKLKPQATDKEPDKTSQPDSTEKSKE